MVCIVTKGTNYYYFFHVLDNVVCLSEHPFLSIPSEYLIPLSL